MKKLMVGLFVSIFFACSVTSQELVIFVTPNARKFVIGDDLILKITVNNESKNTYFFSKKQFALVSPIRFYTIADVVKKPYANLIIDYSPVWGDDDINVLKPRESISFFVKYLYRTDTLDFNGSKKRVRFLERDLSEYNLPALYKERIIIEESWIVLKAIYSQYGEELSKKDIKALQYDRIIESASERIELR